MPSPVRHLPVASSTEPAAVFHDGELDVQRRAGLTAEAARLARMLEQDAFSPGMTRFAAARTSVFLTARDDAGTLWTTVVVGDPGFCRAEDSVLAVGAAPLPGDPLHALAAGQPIGVLLIDFASRRRLRVNGTLVTSGDGLRIAVAQAYGNCPKYIHRELAEPGPADAPLRYTRSAALDGRQRDVVTGAGTFILGTTHPTGGLDTSHRGGDPGFLRVDGDGLWWPDYPGNNVFNSLGNIAVDPAAALLVVDGAGSRLHLTGTASLDWSSPALADDEMPATRSVRFTPAACVGGEPEPS